MQQLPTVVFVHGAFHGPGSFSLVVDQLREAGYPCICDLALPSTGGPAEIGLKEDAAALRSLVANIIGVDNESQGNDVVVVMHSYGGVVGAEALKGYEKSEKQNKAGVRKLVFLAGNIPRLGQSHLEQLTEYMTERNMEFPPILDNKVSGPSLGAVRVKVRMRGDMLTMLVDHRTAS